MDVRIEKVRRLERFRREYERFHTYADYLATEWVVSNVPKKKRRDLDVTIVRNSILGVFGMCRQDDLMRMLETDPRYYKRTKTMLDLLAADLDILAGRLVNECEWREPEPA